MAESENVELCLNHEGQDFYVVVPLETANILLNGNIRIQYSIISFILCDIYRS